jgi:hypothetical protein
MWQNLGFFGKLNEFLIQQVNAQISAKTKENLTHLRDYSAHRTKVKEQVILNLVNWQFYFETCDYLSYPTKEDTETVMDSNNISDSDIMTFTVVLNHALKQYIDNFQEQEPNCLMLYEYYKLLKTETSRRPSLNFYPSSDGFADCLESRAERLETVKQLETARELGNICPNCQSTTEVRSNGNMWKCLSCGFNWRKRT